MPKFHVVLDTNIYRKSPKRKDLAFLALERLAKAGLAQLHLPYLVEREFQTQQVAQYKKEVDASISGLEALVKKGLEPAQLATIQGLLTTLTATAPAILADSEQALPNWVASIGGKRHPLTQAQALGALEAYFQGSAPLKAQKVRDDIPDSFIFQVVVELAQTNKPLVVVAEDEKIAQASEALTDVSVHRSLSSFIESKPVQAELLDLDIVKNLSTLRETIKAYEHEDGQIAHHLTFNGGDALLRRTVHSQSIPDDNHEATITGFYDPTDIDLEFDELSYYGYGEFGLPFSFSANVSITYYVFKADYFSLDEKNLPSVTDHNDHYYEAESEIEVKASGVVKLSFNHADLKSLTTDNVAELMSIDIDSIDDVVADEED